MKNDDSWNPIIFGVATGCFLGAVFLVSSEIWEAIKRGRESNEKSR